MQEIKWVIFDWDGTLMDSIARIVSSLQDAAQEVGVAIPSDQEVKAIIGMSLPKAVDTLFPEIDSATKDALAQAYKFQYIENNQTPSPLLGGAEQLVRDLKYAGFKLAISTGKARSGLLRVLAQSGIADYFDDSICADESVSKPAPDMLLTLLERNQISADQAIMVGDSLLDLEMAKNAQMQAVGVTMGASSRDQLETIESVAIIDSLSELYAILKLEPSLSIA
ncbi:HAD-IA family hydrolase [Catenovulum sp. 2E275]|uniref:HAD family hydrolase n=1 Tax=Catenovulum sp. 2E275 TaxID=2980497 RepID=UPI0021D1F7CE|nr:HAD-IA family hydrolase [Catenovulum sp. 2E275]MCU4674785.1 HAD-IA family hydrolase [Catenovulum sp. 2E275]